MEVWRNSWNTSTEYGQVFFERATGALPEMESSKAMATLLKEKIIAGDRVLDVGCGGGHYLRSLKNTIQVPFSYTGVDITPEYIELANKAWANEADTHFAIGDIYDLDYDDNEFDIVMCSNMLYHLPSIEKPVSELLRVCNKVLALRTLIGERSFYIKEVHSATWDQHSSISPESEFTEDGEPASFNYLNIYSRQYVESIVSRIDPTSYVSFIEDRFFDPAIIQSSSEVITDTERRKAATYILGDMQVIGYVIQPHHFVVIDKAKNIIN